MQAKSPPVRNTSVRTEPRYRPMQRRIDFLRGAGEIAYPVFNIMLGLGFRTAFAFVSVRYIGGYGIMLCRPLGFLISTVSLSCRYFTKNWQGR